MTDAPVNLVTALESWDLRDAAEILDTHAPYVQLLTQPDAARFGETAAQLRELATIREKYDEEQRAIAQAKQDALDAEAARVEALTVAIAATLSPFGKRRWQAEKLLAQFDITPKG